MKKLSILLALLITTNAYAGKIQNEDVKSQADLAGAGAPNSSLLNTNKMWDSVHSQLLDTTLASAGMGSVTSVDLTAPSIFSVAGTPITTSGTIAITYSGTALPVANGGTNSTVALNDNRVMVSVSGSIVEASAITADRAVISDANGIPTHSVVSALELSYVSGVTGSIQAQLDSKAAAQSSAQETPSGAINGSNVTFTLAHIPAAASSVHLYQDGLRLKQGVDYTISGATITMAVPPVLAQELDADYLY